MGVYHDLDSRKESGGKLERAGMMEKTMPAFRVEGVEPGVKARSE